MVDLRHLNSAKNNNKLPNFQERAYSIVLKLIKLKRFCFFKCLFLDLTFGMSKLSKHIDRYETIYKITNNTWSNKWYIYNKFKMFNFYLDSILCRVVLLCHCRKLEFLLHIKVCWPTLRTRMSYPNKSKDCFGSNLNTAKSSEYLWYLRHLSTGNY